MKKMVFALCLLLMMGASLAAAVPELTGVSAGDGQLIIGQDGWSFDFTATEGGTLAMQLLSGETGEAVADLGAVQMEAGTGRVAWNGLMPDGTPAQPGSYMLAVQMRNFWGEESAQSVLSVSLFESEMQAEESRLNLDALFAEEALVWNEADFGEAEQAQQANESRVDENGVPQAASYWDMNPDDYDLTNPAHQQAIWDIMMQPITVLKGDQTENIYITNKPGVNAKPYKENCAGELHGQSQGVRLVEDDTDGDGYVLIEAYSNDGTKSESEYVEGLAAKKVQGYVKKSRLYTEEPSDKYALLVDKLRQKLYVFEDGRIISELPVSTGLNNPKQPYNETPSGEYLTVSRVGDFKAGSRTIGRYAIRINGGTLLHEVLHDVGRDGTTKIYSAYEPDLGKKASHGCIRIPRRKNAEGINMAWLWENLENKTKVIIWEDQGRQMYEPELPDLSTVLYRNPDGGSNYHLDQNCSSVKEKYLPLTGDLTYGDLQTEAFKKLTPCVYCGAPEKPETLYERYAAAAEQIGAVVTDETKAKFGL